MRTLGVDRTGLLLLFLFPLPSKNEDKTKATDDISDKDRETEKNKQDPLLSTSLAWPILLSSTTNWWRNSAACRLHKQYSPSWVLSFASTVLLSGWSPEAALWRRWQGCESFLWRSISSSPSSVKALCPSVWLQICLHAEEPSTSTTAGERAASGWGIGCTSTVVDELLYCLQP